MKNFVKVRNVSLFGIITLLVIIGFSMIACGNGTASNPFQGTWTGYDREGNRVRLYVGDADWTMTLVGYSYALVGSYSRNGNSATLYYDGYNFGSASVSGNSLTLYVSSVWAINNITLYK